MENEKPSGSSLNVKYLPVIFPPIPFVHIYSRGKNVYGYIKTSTWMFIAALFIIAKKWEELQYILIN